MLGHVSTPEQRSELLSLSLTILQRQANLRDQDTTGTFIADCNAGHVLLYLLYGCYALPTCCWKP